MTPSEKAFFQIDKVLSNDNYRKKLTTWELNFLNSCYRQSRNMEPFDTLSMKQKQAVFNITKRFKLE